MKRLTKEDILYILVWGPIMLFQKLCLYFTLVLYIIKHILIAIWNLPQIIKRSI